MDNLYIKAAETHSVRGRTLADEGDFEGAVAAFEEALRVDPRNVEAHISLATIYMNTEDYDKAIEHAQAGLMYDPKSIEAWLSLGNIYDEMGEFDKALEQLKYAMGVDEENPEVYYLMGYIYGEKGHAASGEGDVSEAKRHLTSAKQFMERCLQLEPEHEEAIENLEFVTEMLSEVS